MKALIVLTLVVIELTIALIVAGFDAYPNGKAVCGSDAECAAWEVFNRIPLNQRCYGKPCPPEVR